MSESLRLNNVPGAGKDIYRAVKTPNNADKVSQAAISCAPEKQRKLIEAILNVIHTEFGDQNEYMFEMDVKMTDVILRRMASLLDEFRTTLNQNDLADVKTAILSQIGSKTDIQDLINTAFASYLGVSGSSTLLKELTSMFTSGHAGSSVPAEKHSGPVFGDKAVETLEDEEEGDYKDSKIAKNFKVLQDFISNQLDRITAHVQKLPDVMAKIEKLNMSVFASGKQGKFNILDTAQKFAGTMQPQNSGIFGFFRNQSGQDKAKSRDPLTQRMRDNMLIKLTNGFSSMMKFIKPVINVMKINMVMLMVKIIFIAAKVLAIIAAITLLTVGIILAYMWIKDKIKQFTDWFSSLNIAGKISETYNGMVDSISETYDSIQYIIQDFYDHNIKPVIDPIIETLEGIGDAVGQIWTNTIYPVIKPFTDSIKDLKDKVWAVFGTWDSNKSFLENIGDISEALGDAIGNWWTTSAFKKTWDKTVMPMIDSIGNFIDRVRTVWRNFKFDENKSFAENLSFIWGKMGDAITDWWNKSPIKANWEKFTVFLKDMAKPIRDWYNSSELKKLIDKICNKVLDFGKAIKAAYLEWYETSDLKKWVDSIASFGSAKLEDFKNWYETSDLKKWVDQIKDFGKLVRETIHKWFFEQPFAKTLEEWKDLGTKLKNTIADWWKESSVNKFLTELGQSIKDLSEKAGNITWDLPGVGMIRPFGFLIGKDFKLSDVDRQIYQDQQQEKKDLANPAQTVKEMDERIAQLKKRLEQGTLKRLLTSGPIEDGDIQAEIIIAETRREQAAIAAQKAQQDMQPIKALKEQNAKSNATVAATSKKVAEEIDAKDKANAKVLAEQSADLKYIKQNLANKPAPEPKKEYVPMIFREDMLGLGGLNQMQMDAR